MNTFTLIVIGWFMIFFGLAVIVVVAEHLRHRRKIARSDGRFDSIVRGLASDESEARAQRDEDAA